jgi:hypothetical protein
VSLDGQDSKLVEQRIDGRILEIDEKIEMISAGWNRIFENWKRQMILSEEMSQLNKMFENQQFVLEKE